MRTLVTGLISGLFVVTCQAGVLFSDPGTGTTTVFTATGLTQGAGPFTINGFSVSGSSIVAFGDAPYGLGNNGAWTSFSFVAANSNNGSITFDLGASYGLVGGFMNYSTPHDVTGTNPTIEAIAANGTTVLESDILSVVAPISTPAGSNAGAFRGISRSQNDIRFLRISGDFILTHSLEIGQAPSVPEPGTSGLILCGLGLVFLGRRQSAIRRFLRIPASRQ
jgi:hypothetical protein